MVNTQKLNPLFIPAAIVVVVTSISSTGNYIFNQVDAGNFPWWPYPALFLIFAAVFAVYGSLSKG